jgi:hypothetical protein
LRSLPRVTDIIMVPDMRPNRHVFGEGMAEGGCY